MLEGGGGGGEWLMGDASKARRVLGWRPKVKFEELIRMMVQADLEKHQRDRDFANAQI